ncbi:protein suppressor of variegation 3-7-like [Drosophila kikkawai]|uniref:Protein suppressor of variegation 3-7-like n=1 Tax=Drosophila kikkawai TaxID=30033 RepID=A0A6P4ICD9_DROKI|nr:protein suppressor of variegation 3-7-like [Drosophila kikkawai]
MADWEGEQDVRNEEEQVVAERGASKSPQSETRSESESSEEEDNWSEKQKGTQGLAAKSDLELTKTKELAGVRQQPKNLINSRHEKPRKKMTTSKIAKLKAKFNWLMLDANDESRCHCLICETRLRFTVFHLRQHSVSRKHTRGLKRQKRNNDKNTAPLFSINSEAPADVEVPEPGLEMDMDSDTDKSMRSDGSMAEPPAKRSRKHILRANQKTKNKRHEERSQLDMDKICSSLDIFNRLVTKEGKGNMGQDNNTGQPSEPRHPMDLFFDSIVPTMKSLPADLAAEGKANIMQVVCNLEIKAMRRDSAKAASRVSTPAPLNPVAAPPATAAADSAAAAASFKPKPAADIDFHSKVITINEDDQIMQNNNNDLESTPNTSANGDTTVSLANTGNPQDLLDVNKPRPCRFVPLHKLMNPNLYP